MKISNNKKGFTLIEIMVSVSIFVIVAFIASTAFITVNEANKRAQAIRLIVDNLNFTLDGMTYRLAEGVEYQQDSTKDITFQYKPAGANVVDHVTYRWGPRLDDNNNEIPDSETIYLIDNEFPSPGVSLISDEISIEDAKFEVINNKGRAYVAISIRGKAKIGREETALNLQTVVTQRNY